MLDEGPLHQSVPHVCITSTGLRTKVSQLARVFDHHCTAPTAYPCFRPPCAAMFGRCFRNRVRLGTCKRLLAGRKAVRFVQGGF